MVSGSLMSKGALNQDTCVLMSALIGLKAVTSVARFEVDILGIFGVSWRPP